MRLFTALFFLALLSACAQKGPSLTVTKQTRLDSVPSGSALLLRGDTAYVVGDDATGIYLLLAGSGHLQKLPLAGFDATQFREPKYRKHDFEASVFLQEGAKNGLVAFGSGTAPGRDSILRFDLGTGHTQTVSAAALYNRLKVEARIAASDWNLEGAAVAGNVLHLLNRGTNTLLSVPLATFNRSLADGSTHLTGIQMQHWKLPTVGGYEARISGAAALGDTALLFCASVEATTQWRQDGAVLGSFIGHYSLRKRRVLYTLPVTDNKGVMLKEKIESIDLRRRGGAGALNLLAVADNDDGTSTLLEMQLIQPR